ncbi:MAG: glycosyltransferase [Deltaproteobacteria bacterium]|nr:glycosyltransferase [Deltaproteobacteria bacterium]
MKILLIAPQPFYQDRGTPIAVRLMAQTLGEQGHDVHLLVFHEGEEVIIPNVTIHRNRAIPGISDIKPGLSLKKLICDFFLFIKCIQLIRTGKFDLIHAVEEAVFMAVVVKKIFRIPYVYDMDSCMSLQLIDKFPSLHLIRRLMEWLEQRAVVNSSGVIAVCQTLEDIARKFAPDKLIARLEDITLLATETEGKDSLREGLGITGLIIMYVGNLERYQGIDLLIESFKEALVQKEALNLVIIGGNKDDILFYQQRVEQLGMQKNIFFCGQRPVDLLGYYLGQADILVSPRIQGNNTPMKIYSYLDSGKPVLATRLPTHTQVLDETIACLVNPATMEMAAGIIELAENVTLRATLGFNAKERVKEEYSLPAFKRKLTAFYKKLPIR